MTSNADRTSLLCAVSGDEVACLSRANVPSWATKRVKAAPVRIREHGRPLESGASVIE